MGRKSLITENIAGTYEDKIRWVTEHLDADEIPEARYILRELLNDDPNDFWVIHLQAFAERATCCFGAAFLLWKKALEIVRKQNKSFYYHLFNDNIGECLHMLWRHDEALKYLEKAIELDPQDANTWNNLAVCYLYTSRPDQCEAACRKTLEISPNHIGGVDNLSISQLYRRQWAEGWSNYEISLGGMYRMRYEYNIKGHKNPTWWEGEQNETIIVSGEQGLGDEIMFASAIPDVEKQSKKVILECNSKLEGLFQRSFPNVDVHGTRHKATTVFKTVPTAATSLASMLRFTRKGDADFNGKPYLVACPKRTTQWRALFDSLGPQPKIGIAWTGGVRLSGRNDRCIPLDAWGSVLELDAHFINLEYESGELDILRQKHNINTYPWGTLTNDYDDTAALVNELDLVIATTTSVVHLAGGLGVPCWCIVNRHPNWRFGPQPENEDNVEHLIWTESVELIRQVGSEEWNSVMERVAVKLTKFIEKK